MWKTKRRFNSKSTQWPNCKKQNRQPQERNLLETCIAFDKIIEIISIKSVHQQRMNGCEIGKKIIVKLLIDIGLFVGSYDNYHDNIGNEN